MKKEFFCTAIVKQIPLTLHVFSSPIKQPIEHQTKSENRLFGQRPKVVGCVTSASLLLQESWLPSKLSACDCESQSTVLFYTGLHIDFTLFYIIPSRYNVRPHALP
jgi:hypothetical protein